MDPKDREQPRAEPLSGVLLRLSCGRRLEGGRGHSRGIVAQVVLHMRAPSSGCMKISMNAVPKSLSFAVIFPAARIGKPLVQAGAARPLHWRGARSAVSVGP